MIIIILGPQGSGKGTQAKLLADKFKLFYLSTGELLREISKTRKDLQEMVNQKGVLVPDETTFSLMTEHLSQKGMNDNIVFDGYPRSVKQYDLLKDWLAGNNKKIDLAIVLEISEKESIRRLSNRRMDPKTGKIYNLETSPKPGPEIDIKTLIQREDDKPEAIKKRLEEYKNITEPLIGIFEKEDVLTKVDGERPIEVIHEDMVNLVEKKLQKK